MTGLVLLIGGLFVGCTARCCGDDAPPLSLPAEVQTLVDQTLELADQTDVTPPSTQAKLATRFGQLLHKLAARLDDQPRLAERVRPAEGTDVRAKLITIAWDRWHHPDLYEEISAKYLHAVDNPRRQAPVSPALQDKHATEKYRLAWEYFLLQPPQRISPDSLHRCMQALERIHNDASVLTLRYRYHISCREGARNLDTFQTHLLTALSGFHTQKALQAMLECVELSQRRQPRQGVQNSLWDPEHFVHDVLTGRFHRRDAEQWHEAVTTLPREELSASQRQILERVLKTNSSGR